MQMFFLKPEILQMNHLHELQLFSQLRRFTRGNDGRFGGGGVYVGFRALKIMPLFLVPKFDAFLFELRFVYILTCIYVLKEEKLSSLISHILMYNNFEMATSRHEN